VLGEVLKRSTNYWTHEGVLLPQLLASKFVTIVLQELR